MKSMDKGSFSASHSILNTEKKDISPRYDKGGAFHYENYISELYFYLLSHNQKASQKGLILKEVLISIIKNLLKRYFSGLIQDWMQKYFRI
jgi:hypothetical protein